jgi:hypothetical protein
MEADKMIHPTLERHGEQWRHKKRIPTDVLPHFGRGSLRNNSARPRIDLVPLLLHHAHRTLADLGGRLVRFCHDSILSGYWVSTK